MSRPNKPWFRKSNKRWYIWHNGKQVNLGPDKSEAFKQFHELMAQAEPRELVRTNKLSLPELVDHFLEWVQRNRAPDTYEWYRYRLERLCRLHPTIVAECLKPYHVEQWINGYELSVTSRRNYIRATKRCYRWGKSQGYLKFNPIAEMEAPRAENREVVLLPNEFEHMMSFVRNPGLADLLRVTWLSGCRPQESLIVEAGDVDVPNQRWVLSTRRSKGKRVSRVVYLCEPAMQIVTRRMKSHPTGPIFVNAAGRQWTKDSVNCAVDAIRVRMGKVVMEEQGKQPTDEQVEELMHTLKPTRCSRGREVTKTDAELRCEAKRKLTAKEAKSMVPRYSLYALRHSFATNALRNGVDSLTVAILLGHQDPSTLARVYQHLNQSPKHLLEQTRQAVGSITSS